MTGEEVKEIRMSLKITQVQLGQLLGVHHMTVSKWERNQYHLKPSPYQVALLKAFAQAQFNLSDLGICISTLHLKESISTYGPISTLHKILDVAYKGFIGR